MIEMAKKRKLNAFEKQFVANRRAGKKTFTFGGKSYSTKLADQGGGGGGGGTAKVKTKTTAAVPTKEGGIAITMPNKAPRPTARPDTTTTAAVSKTTLPKTAPRPTPRPTTTTAAVTTRPRPTTTTTAAVTTRPVDLERRARDVGQTRKEMELATGSPSPRGTPIRQATPKAAVATRSIDLTRRAADVADTRKRMELAIGSPSPRGTPIRQATAKTSPVDKRIGALTVTPDKKRKTLATLGTTGYKR